MIMRHGKRSRGFFTQSHFCLQRVKITFFEFDLERDCEKASVKVSDGTGTTIYCGNTKPEDYESSSYYAFVQFRTDSSVTFGGYFAMYNAVDPTIGKWIDYGGHIMIHYAELRTHLLYDFKFV